MSSPCFRSLIWCFIYELICVVGSVFALAIDVRGRANVFNMHLGYNLVNGWMVAAVVCRWLQLTRQIIGKLYRHPNSVRLYVWKANSTAWLLTSKWREASVALWLRQIKRQNYLHDRSSTACGYTAQEPIFIITYSIRIALVTLSQVNKFDRIIKRNSYI